MMINIYQYKNDQYDDCNANDVMITMIMTMKVTFIVRKDNVINVIITLFMKIFSNILHYILKQIHFCKTLQQWN